MRQARLLGVVLIALASPIRAQTGITYRFQADSLVGRVWAVGDDARRELESGEGGTAAGRIEIWKQGGAQIFILSPASRTYYEENAFRTRTGLPRVSAEPLTARRPFRVEAVDGLTLDFDVLPGIETVSGIPCRRAMLTFAYVLRLRLESADAAMPGRVEGTQDLCLADAPAPVRMPFGHGAALTTGHPEVDAAIAARLTGVNGIPVARMLKVARRIENGEWVAASSAFLLSDLREAVVTRDQLEIPRDYRFREPEIVPPVRRTP
jgi:hypothetical protein